MAADDEQALLAFLADLGDGDDPVDAADPDDAQWPRPPAAADLAFRPPPSWGPPGGLLGGLLAALEALPKLAFATASLEAPGRPKSDVFL